MRYFVFFCTILILIQSCSRKGISALSHKGVKITNYSLPINLNKGNHTVKIQYLGCGGLYILHEHKGIMIDPFFSYQSFFTLGKAIVAGGKIKPKPADIQFGKKRILDSLGLNEKDFQQNTVAIFSAHGHYDHLMDIPYIFKHWFSENIDVYVNQSSFNTCKNVIQNDKLHEIESIASIRDQQGKSIDFSTASGAMIKVYPIHAGHNPHINNIKLFSGSVKHPPKNFNQVEEKTPIRYWLEGQTLSFLIDIEKNDTIIFRMFVQSSSTNYPNGMPPKNLLAKKPVDLVVLGVASYKYSESTYPCAYLNELKPKQVMYIHWEDFFQSYKREPRSVLKNDIPRFFNKIVTKCTLTDYILPIPGVVLQLKY
jgi:ribonuclease BN (tRNA processing enzyme)